jgi:putative membrane protein
VIRNVRVVPVIAAGLVLGMAGAASVAVGHGTSGADGRPIHHRHRYSAWDEQWLTMSMQGDMFEVQGGHLAETRGTIDAVKDLGATLVRDHTTSLAQSRALAERLGITVPSGPSPTQKWQLRAVDQLSGATFDHWYADLEVQDHVQDIQEARDEVEDGWNRAVRRDARMEIPTLRKHLAMARAALASS